MNSRGFSLYELLIALGVASIVSVSALSNLSALKNPLDSGAESTVGFLKQVRAKAASTTSAYFVGVTGNNRLYTTYAENCSVDEEDRTADLQMILDLPKDVTVNNTSWTTCFTSRGLASSDSQLIVQDIGSRTRIIEVFLGGAVRVN
jgi:prepilin-type N-terminal cleavage/methylation domain-containing protein